MEVLGHPQLSITMDLYSHVMPTALRDAQRRWIGR
jgi:integrase